jgi:hypothetical protein
MADEGSVQDMEIEWHDFLVKFHEENENAKQRIRKVNNIDYFMQINIVFFF